jgi:hypothetical protein
MRYPIGQPPLRSADSVNFIDFNRRLVTDFTIPSEVSSEELADLLNLAARAEQHRYALVDLPRLVLERPTGP